MDPKTDIFNKISNFIFYDHYKKYILYTTVEVWESKKWPTTWIKEVSRLQLKSVKVRLRGLVTQQNSLGLHDEW